MEKIKEEYLLKVFPKAQKSTTEKSRREEKQEFQYGAAFNFVLKTNKNISESKAEELARTTVLGTFLLLFKQFPCAYD